MSAVKLGPSGLGSAGDTYRRMLWSKVTSRDFAGTDRALTRTMLAQLSPNAARALPPAVSKTAATHAAISAGTRTPRSWVHDIWSAIKAGAEALRVPAQGLLAQAALETGWGRHARGNNVFGVKAHGDGSTLTALTHEFTDGIVHEVHATFQSYRSIAHAVDDFVHVVQRLHPQALGQETVSAFAQALQASGYATDPHYARKIEAVAASPRMRSILAEVK
jgi:flagellar protein FlgJ